MFSLYIFKYIYLYVLIYKRMYIYVQYVCICKCHIHNVYTHSYYIILRNMWPKSRSVKHGSLSKFIICAPWLLRQPMELVSFLLEVGHVIEPPSAPSLCIVTDRR